MALALLNQAKWNVLLNKPLYKSLANRHYSYGRQNIATQRLLFNKSLISTKVNRAYVIKNNLSRIKNVNKDLPRIKSL